jgi:hypothetical protein
MDYDPAVPNAARFLEFSEQRKMQALDGLLWVPIQD